MVFNLCLFVYAHHIHPELNVTVCFDKFTSHRKRLIEDRVLCKSPELYLTSLYLTNIHGKTVFKATTSLSL